MLRAKVGIELRRVGPQAEEPVVLEERGRRAESETEKDARGESCHRVRPRSERRRRPCLRIEQRAVLLDDELAAQWDHEQNAEPAAKRAPSAKMRLASRSKPRKMSAGRVK